MTASRTTTKTTDSARDRAMLRAPAHPPDAAPRLGLRENWRRRLRNRQGDHELFVRTSWRDLALSSASQAGLVNNLNDGLAWGLFPLFFAAAGLSLREIGVLAFIYPATWGIVQLCTGALSDRIGRKRLIAGGMMLQGIALLALVLVHWRTRRRVQHGDRHRGNRASDGRFGIARRAANAGDTCRAPKPRIMSRAHRAPARFANV